MKYVAFVLVASRLSCPLVSGQEATQDEKEIRSNASAYVEAYGKKDAKALAALWAEDGQFISPVSGEAMSGRANIAKEYTNMFDEP